MPPCPPRKSLQCLNSQIDNIVATNRSTAIDLGSLTIWTSDQARLPAEFKHINKLRVIVVYFRAVKNNLTDW